MKFADSLICAMFCASVLTSDSEVASEVTCDSDRCKIPSTFASDDSSDYYYDDKHFDNEEFLGHHNARTPHYNGQSYGGYDDFSYQKENHF